MACQTSSMKVGIKIQSDIQHLSEKDTAGCVPSKQGVKFFFFKRKAFRNVVQTRRQGKEVPQMRRGGPTRQQETVPRARGEPSQIRAGATPECAGEMIRYVWKILLDYFCILLESVGRICD